MKFIHLFSLLSMAVGSASCSNSAVAKKLSGSDSLAITFNMLNSDSIIKTVSTTENNAINKVVDFIDAKPTEEFKCGYDGNLIFFSKGQVLLAIVFKYKDANCRHFLFELDGKLMSTKMNNEAADFLESLEQGKIFY
jgi:hypothetical protein